MQTRCTLSRSMGLARLALGATLALALPAAPADDPAGAAAATPRPARICTDVNFWYPFTFVERGRSVGLHVDLVAAALAQRGLAFDFRPVPWKRCLHEAEHGGVDAVVSASWQAARAQYLDYPPDAAAAPPSRWRITQVEYVVVTAANDAYEYDGDMASLPRPARAPAGYSVIDDLRRAGVAVDEAPGDENNLRKLIRDGRGVVVTIPEIVRVLLERAEFKGRLKVCRRPLLSKSYHLAFSQRSGIAPAERQAIWDEIARLRSDAKFMDGIAAKYAAADRAP